MAQREPTLRGDELAYVSPVAAAQVLEPAPAAMWAVYLMLAMLFAAIGWAAVAQVDIVAKANGRVIPDGREQVIASLEGGILRELLVREGQQVTQGQALALLDPTRFEAQQAEGTAKRMALAATRARLEAEAAGDEPHFDKATPPEVQQAERQSWQARQRALQEAVETNRRSAGLLQRELAVAEGLAGKGLMSEVETMRVRRQLNELQLQAQERINRFRQDAAADLVRVRNELAQLEEQMVVRDDALRRTTLNSPVRGIVKVIRINTVGGVIAPGAPVMEVVPLSDRVLIEARVRPSDIGFVKVGQPVQMKLSSYEYTIYGALQGKVLTISPDALGDPERAAQPEGTWYRAIVEADSTVLSHGDKELDVLPGMTGQVEIRTGERSVLAFVLRPMLKTQEAFRER
jgi:membrane fusion protein, adhesin transport system